MCQEKISSIQYTAMRSTYGYFEIIKPSENRSLSPEPSPQPCFFIGCWKDRMKPSLKGMDGDGKTFLK
jgi:hypothetical protein